VLPEATRKTRSSVAGVKWVFSQWRGLAGFVAAAIWR
jgi:hypothetical protein